MPHALYQTRGTIVNVDEMSGSYTVGKTGIVKGAGELTSFDRTGNTYGMEAWAFVGQSEKASEGFVRRSQLHKLQFHKPAGSHC